MDRFSEALEEAAAYAPADAWTVCGIELLHPQFVDGENNSDSIRVALDERGWDLEHEAGAPLFGGQVKRYDPLAMRITLPEQAEGTLGTLNLAIDNVPRSIWPKLQRAAQVRASALVIYREWVGTRDLETGEITISGPPDAIIDQLTMKVVRANQLQLSGSAGFVDLLNKGFPRRTFNRDDFPGLHGVSF